MPDGCHWTVIRDTPQNVGAALRHAMQEIERANPDTLYRVFGAADWGNKEKFTDELLKDMIEGFSSISLGNHAVDTDILGDAMNTSLVSSPTLRSDGQVLRVFNYCLWTGPSE